jgi:hypothetical protein
MRENIYTLPGLLITWVAIFFIVPATGFDIKMWVLIVSASIGSIFAGLLVLAGETIIENIILVLILLVLAGILWGTTPGLGFIFISALLSGVIGVIINQINQYAANKHFKNDSARKRASHL